MVVTADGGDDDVCYVCQGFWDDVIWVCQADNGGPSFTGDNHTANNYPLRGAKYSNFEVSTTTTPTPTAAAAPSSTINTIPYDCYNDLLTSNVISLKMSNTN